MSDPDAHTRSRIGQRLRRGLLIHQNLRAHFAGDARERPARTASRCSRRIDVELPSDPHQRESLIQHEMVAQVLLGVHSAAAADVQRAKERLRAAIRDL